ncbi:site-2 protease family protein [Paenarthrobacter sp. DKR-5]|uniref:M50 family metallopeptidase n=1 Tax=Paenarthrobacter sp. DKR-5 TaxID=2835535 RepID=UPI001BDC3768|nr:site-2 protease family protein [Paenarthrobacter sp. DKR-5]MBT1002677.1 site-2 protease family protein [Paenarthrobacter sp. DKR-5]
MAVGIAASIALHEVGHLLPAKLFNVRVTKYMIGFGPTLWSRTKGETEYGFKAIPLGGYVSMVGMYPPAKEGGPVRASSTGMFQTLAEEARSASAEEITDQDRGRLFYQLPVWKKVIIMLGGPTMNLLIGVVLFAVLLMGFGTPQATTTIADVSKCQVQQGRTAGTDTAACKPTPAAAAGIQPGDEVVSLGGTPVTSWNQFTAMVRSSAGKQEKLTVKRGGQLVNTTITPVLTSRPVVGADGQPVLDANGKQQYQDVGFVGMGAASKTVPQPASAVLPAVGDNIARVAGVVVNLPARVVAVGKAAFSNEPRDPNGPISVVGVGRVAGEVASLDQVPAVAKAATLVSLLGGVNLALFVFNLVPLLPLDGGHIAGALYEGARRRIAKLFGRRDPGPVDIAKLLPLTYVVGALLLGMSALLIYADIVKPVNIFG